MTGCSMPDIYFILHCTHATKELPGKSINPNMLTLYTLLLPLSLTHPLLSYSQFPILLLLLPPPLFLPLLPYTYVPLTLKQCDTV